MPGKQHPLEVFGIEWGWDATRYLSKGHHDPEAFREAYRKEYCYWDRKNPDESEQPWFTLDQVKQGYMRSWPDSTGNYYHFFRDAERGPGAFPVTYVESK